MRTVVLATAAGLAIGLFAGFQMADFSGQLEKEADQPASVAPGDGWASLAEVKSPAVAEGREKTPASAGKSVTRGATDKEKSKSAGKPAAKAGDAGKNLTRTEDRSRKKILTELRSLDRAPADEKTNRRREELIDKLSDLDPASAADYAAMLLEQGAGSEQLFRKATSAYAKANVTAAAAWAASLRTPLVRDAAVREVMEVWSARDLAGAATGMSMLPVGSAQTTAATAIAKRYARADLDGALAWMNGLQGAVQSAAFKAILADLWQGSSAVEVASALPWVLSLQSPVLRAQGLRFIGSELALRQDALSALGNAMLVTDTTQREWFVQSVLDNFVKSNPQGAAAWLLTPAASPYAASMADKVVSGWAAFEPVAAAQWAAGVSNASLRTKSVAAATRTWAQTAPEDAANWIATLQDPATRDTALGALSAALARTAPASAAQFASKMSDPNSRDNAVTQVVAEWKKTDAASAVSFVNSAAFLPHKLRQNLLK